MAFDFPSNPAVGDEYVSGGCKYTWTGLVWDLSGMDAALDYVQTAGDTMTGTLHFAAMPTTATNAIEVEGEAGAKVLALSGSSAAHSGIIEFYDPNGTTRRGYMGYGSATALDFVSENGAIWVFRNSLLMTGGGLRWGNDSAVTDPLDFSKGICLYGYGGASEFGFTITGGTLNYVVESTSNQHVFRVGAEDVMNVKSDGVRIPGGNLNVTGSIQASGLISSTVAQGNNGFQLNDGGRINFSNGCLIYKNYGSNDFMFHTNSSQVFTFHISGTGDVYVIDTVGSTGNSVNVTAPEALALGKELGVACRKSSDTADSVDLAKVMAATLVKIKALENKVAALERKK